MSFSFKPEKINTFYALMASLAIVSGTILLQWMIKSKTSNEKIITGVFTVAFFVFFLFIIYKILTHENRSVDTLDKRIDAENSINNLTRQVRITMIRSYLNELKNSSIENQDLISIQKINFILSYLDSNQLQSSSISNKKNRENKSEFDDVSDLLSMILNRTLK